MKFSHCALVTLFVCGLATDATWGQTLRHPTSVRPASLRTDDYDSYYGFYDEEEEEASPSDAAVPQEAEEPAIAMSVDGCDPCCASVCDSCCDTACGSCFLFGPDEAVTLLPNTNDFGLRVGFWSQIGYHTEGTNGFGTGLFNNYPNRVQLQQQWLFLEKAIDTSCCDFDWGFRVDYVYGTDGPDTQAFGGRFNDWDFGWYNGGAYGHAIPQAYADFGYGNLKARLGKFYTIAGYESVMAPENFFYSHSFEMYLSEPFSHTGVLFDYEMAEDITVIGGWTAGWDTGFTRNGGSNFLGGLKLQVTDRAALSYVTSWGDVGFDGRFFGFGSDQNGYFHTILFTYDLNERWSYVLQSNYTDNDQFLLSSKDLITWNNYLFYALNDCWKFGLRYEWYKDPRIGLPSQGAENEINSVTVGLNYRPAANVVIRPEMRWDDFHRDARLLRDSSVFGIDTIITY